MQDTAQSRIIETPLFQINLLIWGLWPDASPPIVPGLANAGLRLAGIDMPLHPGPDIADRFFEWFGNRTAPSPDVIAESMNPGEPFVMFECKVTTFGPTSTTTHQAKKLLASASSVRTRFAIGGESRPVVLAYVVSDTGFDQAFFDALSQLESIVSAECDACRYYVYTVTRTGDGIGLRPKGGSATLMPSLTSGDITIIMVDPLEDPRPLYVLPYDPDIQYPTQYDQDAAERDFLERVAVSIAGEVGRSRIGERVVINLGQHFEHATYGFARFWRNRDVIRNLKILAGRHLRRRFRAIDDPVIVQIEQETVEFVLRTDEQRKLTIAELLTSIKENELAQPELPLGD